MMKKTQIWHMSGLKNLKKFALKAFAMMTLYPLVTAAVWAADMGQESMPWVSPLEKITAVISGPVAQFVGVICIVIAGLGIALGEGGSGVRKLFQIVFGLAIAFTAASIVTKFFGASSGLVF